MFLLKTKQKKINGLERDQRREKDHETISLKSTKKKEKRGKLVLKIAIQIDKKRKNTT